MPAVDEENLTPRTTEEKSSTVATAGVASSVQMVTPIVAESLAVVKDQVAGAAMTLPVASVAPLIVTV